MENQQVREKKIPQLPHPSTKTMTQKEVNELLKNHKLFCFRGVERQNGVDPYGQYNKVQVTHTKH